MLSANSTRETQKLRSQKLAELVQSWNFYLKTKNKMKNSTQGEPVGMLKRLPKLR